MKKMKYCSVVMLAGSIMLATSTVLTGCSMPTSCEKKIVITTGFNDGELLKISSKAVSIKEAMIILISEKESYDKGLDANFWNIEYNGRTMVSYFKDEIKDEVIRLNVLSTFADSKDMSLAEEEEKLLSAATTLYMERANEKVLKDYGISEKDVKAVLRKIILSDKVYEKVVNNYQVEISDEEARVMYANYIYLDEKAAHAKDIANEISGKVNAGSDLNTVAEKYDYATYAEGYVSRKNFEEKAAKQIFRLKDGEVSSVVESNGKLYIIKCINDYDEAMTNSNKELLLEDKKNEEFYKEYKPYEKSINVEFNNDLWEKLKMPDDDVSIGVNIYNILEEVAALSE